MAYLRTLSKPRCHCGKPATVELVNQLNAPSGKFCRTCGKRKLHRMASREGHVPRGRKDERAFDV